MINWKVCNFSDRIINKISHRILFPFLGYDTVLWWVILPVLRLSFTVSSMCLVTPFQRKTGEFDPERVRTASLLATHLPIHHCLASISVVQSFHFKDEDSQIF
jgi:hypothetical protein